MISFSDIYNKLTNSETWTKLFTDPLKMSLLMAASILVIIYLLIRTELDPEGSGMLNIMGKAAVYISVAMLAGLFIFHGSLQGKIEDRFKSKNDENVVKQTLEPVEPIRPIVPIVPIVPITPTQTIQTIQTAAT